MEVLAQSLKHFALRFNPFRDKINLVTFNTIAALNIPLIRTQEGFKVDDFEKIEVGSQYQTNIASGLMTAFVDTYNYLYNLANAGAERQSQRDVLGDSVDLVWIVFTDGAPTAGLFNYTNWNYSYWGSPAIDLQSDTTVDYVNYGPHPSEIKTTLFNAYNGSIPNPARLFPENFVFDSSLESQKTRASLAVASAPGKYISTGFLNYKISLTPTNFNQSVSSPFGFAGEQRVGRIPVISPIMNPEAYRVYSNSGSVAAIPGDATNVNIKCSKPHTEVTMPTKSVESGEDLFRVIQKLVRSSAEYVFGISDGALSGGSACLVDNSGVDYVSGANGGCLEHNLSGDCVVPAIDFCVPDCTWTGISSEGKTHAKQVVVRVSQNDGVNVYDKDNLALKSYYMLAVAWTEFLRSLIGAKIGGAIKVASSRVFTIGLGSAAPLQASYNAFSWQSYITSTSPSELLPDAWQDISDDLSRKDIVLLNMANDYAASSPKFVQQTTGENLVKMVSFGGVKPDFCEIKDSKGKLMLSINTNSCGEYYPVRTATDLNEVFSSIARKIQMSMIN
jgi:hypothetical protein